MDLFEVIKFDSIIPFPAFAKTYSQHGVTFEVNLNVFLWRMDGINTNASNKMPSFEEICLDIKAQLGVNLVHALF